MPAEAALRELAARNSFAHDVPLGDLIDNEKFQGIVLKEIQAAGRRGGLAGIEIVSGVLMVHDEWTPQNVSSPVGCLPRWNVLLTYDVC